MPVAEAKPNPLAPARRQAPEPHPALRHAQIWQAAQAVPPDQLAGQTERASYATPILGALAGDPKVTAKDVIKAVASAAADGKIQPSAAVKLISSMPTDPDKIRPWLKTLYEANMSAAVHLKAATMKAAQPPSAPVAPAPAAPAGVNPLAAAPQVAA